MWVQIVRDVRVYPLTHHRFAIDYRAGQVVPVRRLWGEAMIAAGDAVAAPTPPHASELAHAAKATAGAGGRAARKRDAPAARP